jgi:hypothetical protein
VRRGAATAPLGAACIIWSAVPLGGTGWAGVVLVVVASVCVLGAAFRLMARGGSRTVQSAFAARWSGWLGPGSVLQRAGWESVAAVSIVGLEALHHSRPWHTAVLVLLVASYLLAVGGDRPVPADVRRAEARVLVVSLPLVIVAILVGMLPSAGTGATSGWLEIIAAITAVTAGALALPL